MQRLIFFAGGSSLILHLGFATLLVDRFHLPESVRPPVTVTVSLASSFSSAALPSAEAAASLRPAGEPESKAPSEAAANELAANEATAPVLASSAPVPAAAERVETPERPASALAVPSALPESRLTEAGTGSEPLLVATNDAPLRPPMPAAQSENPSLPASEVGTPLAQEEIFPDAAPDTAPALPRERVAAETPVPVAETVSSDILPPPLAPKQSPEDTPRHASTALVVAAPSAEAGDATPLRLAGIVTPATPFPPAAMHASPLPVSDPGRPTTPSLAQDTETVPSLSETPPPLVEQPAAGEVKGIEVPPTSVLASSHSVADMVGFIDRYDGGSCFFVSAADMTKDSAKIESFSDSKERVDAFDAAFHAGIGLEANVTGQRVLKPQCPMVDFLKLERGNLAKAPVLHIERRYLKDGDTLSGDIQGTGDRFVTLLLVSEKGMVQNLSKWLNDRGDAKTFSIPLRHEQTGGKSPQILVAIASTAPLPDMGLAPVTEDGFFLALSEHAFLTRQGVQTAGKLFVLTD